MAKSFNLFDSDSLKDFHKRIFFSMLLFLFVYFVAVYRITQIMIIVPVDKIVQVNETLKERGKIFDRNGNLLATTINSNSLSTNPIKIKNKLPKKWIQQRISLSTYKRRGSLVPCHMEKKKVPPTKNDTSS